MRCSNPISAFTVVQKQELAELAHSIVIHVNLCVCMCVGKPLQLHLQACDVKSKEEKSGPENMLTEPNTGDGAQTIHNVPNNTGFKI